MSEKSPDNLVNNIVNKIAKAVHPDRIILFGSRALGTAYKDSDVDLLLIYSGSKPKRELKQEIYRLFPRPDFPMCRIF